ncbi:hypothetical protein BDR03DRAFT_933797 [Suillus americanus]|nr:hypothetical protein BDR03DRAFT_933797 [Suillus americanus]
MSWMVTGSNRKSVTEVKYLVNDVMKVEDFTLDDFEHFNPNTQMKHFDMSEDNDAMGILQRDGWKSTDVKIMVPSKEKNPRGNECVFSVSGLFYRPLISVIQAAFSEQSSKWFHLTPFKCIWKSPITGQEQRLYDELYTSDAWIQAHDELQKQRRDDNCKLERVIAGLMFWSDATHLTQFGNPNSGACHPLPASITSFISTFIKRKNVDDLLTHCKRELFHAVWRILLDDEFVRAYENGIVIKCHDGVHRHVFPRIFTYSADYPEKVLLATIRDKGTCPCPRCLTPKSMFNRVGFLHDISQRMNRLRTYFTEKVSKARNAIYMRGAPIKGALVESLLKDVSLVPTVNSFVDHLSPLGFNLFPAIVVDLLHEFELGILKAVMMHLMRLLYAVDP